VEPLEGLSAAAGAYLLVAAAEAAAEGAVGAESAAKGLQGLGLKADTAAAAAAGGLQQVGARSSKVLTRKAPPTSALRTFLVA
jgi:hypothetical protein